MPFSPERHSFPHMVSDNSVLMYYTELRSPRGHHPALGELRQRSGLGGRMPQPQAGSCHAPSRPSHTSPCCEKFMLHQGFLSLFCSYRQQYSRSICAQWPRVLGDLQEGITFKLHTTTCVSHSQSWAGLRILHVAWLKLLWSQRWRPACAGRPGFMFRPLQGRAPARIMGPK